MEIYVLCKLCNCYVSTDLVSQIIAEHPDNDTYECFECQSRRFNRLN